MNPASCPRGEVGPPPRGRIGAGMDRAAAEGRTGGRPPGAGLREDPGRPGLPGQQQRQRQRGPPDLQGEQGGDQGSQGRDSHGTANTLFLTLFQALVHFQLRWMGLATPITIAASGEPVG